MISAIQYERTCYESMFDRGHGNGKKVIEIFIPEHQLIINSGGGIFKSNRPFPEKTNVHGDVIGVKPTKNIEIDKNVVDKIVKVANLKFEFEKQQKELEPDLKSLWFSKK